MAIHQDTLNVMLTVEAKQAGFTLNHAQHGPNLELRHRGALVDLVDGHTPVSAIRTTCRRYNGRIK